MKIFLSFSIILIFLLGIISFRTWFSEVNNPEDMTSVKNNCTKSKLIKSETDSFIFQTNPFYQ